MEESYKYLKENGRGTILFYSRIMHIIFLFTYKQNLNLTIMIIKQLPVATFDLVFNLTKNHIDETNVNC